MKKNLVIAAAVGFPAAPADPALPAAYVAAAHAGLARSPGS